MNAGTRHWTVRLTAAADSDFQGILRWTAAHFGEAQAREYAKTLSIAIDALAAGPNAAAAKERQDIAKGLMTLHVARKGSKERHIVLFRIGLDPELEVIDVLRLLHDAMDPQRHVPPADERT